MIKGVHRSLSTTVLASNMHKLFKTIENEVEQPLRGTVKGSIPTWVNGSLYRNGPGMYEFGDYKFKHWFDGMAMIQRFHITNGNVTYQRKYIQSDVFKTNKEANRIARSEFATPSVVDPCKNIFQRFLTVFESVGMTDNTNVTIFPLNDDLYAATETMYLNKINPDTLDKVDKVNLKEKIGVDMTTAHAHSDAEGNMYNIGHSFSGGLFTVLVAVPPKKDGEQDFPKGEIVYKVKSPWKLHFNYYHSFSMTENYFVFVQQPLLASVPTLMSRKFTSSTFASSMTYHPEIKNRFRIVDRKTGKEVNEDCVFESDSFFYFHQINAYEEQGHLIIDMACHKNHKALELLYMKTLSSEEVEESYRDVPEAEARRYVIPLDVKGQEPKEGDMVTLEHTTAKCKKIKDKTFHLEEEILADIGIELPTINYGQYNTKKYRYIYGFGQRNNEKPLFRLVKIDANTKTFLEWKEDRCYPSEPVFIPRPEGDAEDDGVLISAVSRAGEEGKENSCYMLVLDGKSFKEIARVEFEGIERFPRDFHGTYTEDKK